MRYVVEQGAAFFELKLPVAIQLNEHMSNVYELALHPFVIYAPHALPTLCVPSSIPILSLSFLYHPYIPSLIRRIFNLLVINVGAQEKSEGGRQLHPLPPPPGYAPDGVHTCTCCIIGSQKMRHL